MELYIKSMGKMIKITFFTTNLGEANAWIDCHADEGLILERDGVIFLANIHDK